MRQIGEEGQTIKIELELTEEQLSLMINALEVTFRIMMGQGNIVADLLAEYPAKSKISDKKRWEAAFSNYLTRKKCAEYQLYAMSKTLYGEYRELPEDTHRYSDMWSALRHLQYQIHPHDDGWDTRADEPFAMSDYPMMRVNLIEEEDE